MRRSLRRGCVLGWLRVKVCRRSALLVVLVWLVSWLFLNGLVFVHRNMFSDFCTDDKSKQILQRVVRLMLNFSSYPSECCTTSGRIRHKLIVLINRML